MMFHIIHIPQPMLSFYFLFWKFSEYEIYFHKIPGFQYFFSQIPGNYQVFQVYFKFQVISRFSRSSRSTRHPDFTLICCHSYSLKILLILVLLHEERSPCKPLKNGYELVKGDVPGKADFHPIRFRLTPSFRRPEPLTFFFCGVSWKRKRVREIHQAQVNWRKKLLILLNQCLWRGGAKARRVSAPSEEKNLSWRWTDGRLV